MQRTFYTSKDEESDLGDYGVRKYDDLTGRFTATDPLWEKYYGWSPYVYSANDPVNKVDLTGKNWFSNSNGDIKWFDRAGHFSDTESQLRWFDNGENYPFPMQSGAIEDNSGDFIGGFGSKAGSLISKSLNLLDDLFSEPETGLNEFTQENVNKIVENSKKKYGGNVTVMKGADPLFRVHQPGQKKQENATYNNMIINIDPNGNTRDGYERNYRNFSDQQVYMLLYGINGVNGYSVRTKGGR